MDSSSLRWFPRMGEKLDDFTTQKSTVSEDQETRELSLSPNSNASSSYFNQESKRKVSKIDFSLLTPLENCPIGSKRPSNQPIMNNDIKSSSSPYLLSFSNANSVPTSCKIEAVDEVYNLYDSDQKLFPYLKTKGSYDQKDNQAKKRIPSVDHQDHIIAERKRREKLSQRFVELSAVLPGLKKVDKASILEQAIKHVKELEEKVQSLEEQEKTTRSLQESVMFVNKSQLEEDDNYSSSDENNSHGSISDDISADIEVRVSDKNVLIRITCAKRTAFLLKIYSEIEKLHLTIVNSCMMPFVKHAIDVTIVAQMDDSFCMNLKDLVKHVRMVTGRLLNQA